MPSLLRSRKPHTSTRDTYGTRLKALRIEPISICLVTLKEMHRATEAMKSREKAEAPLNKAQAKALDAAEKACDRSEAVWTATRKSGDKAATARALKAYHDALDWKRTILRAYLRVG